MIRFIVKCFFLTLLLFVSFHQTNAQHKSKRHRKKNINIEKEIRQGTASYYSDKFIGKKTASGERFSQDKLTAACNVLPMGTVVIVTNLTNKKKVKVKINDRLSRNSKRLIDLTKEGAKRLDFLRKGLVQVKIEVKKED